MGGWIERHIAKTHSERHRFENELYFYTNPKYAPFRPKLIAHNDETMTLVIQELIPLIWILDRNDVAYKNKLVKLLEDLHAVGANHRDVHLVNIVKNHNNELKLIDWEVATENIGERSADLYGASEAKAPNEFPYLGDNGVWWGDGRADSPIDIWGRL